MCRSSGAKWQKYFRPWTWIWQFSFKTSVKWTNFIKDFIYHNLNFAGCAWRAEERQLRHHRNLHRVLHHRHTLPGVCAKSESCTLASDWLDGHLTLTLASDWLNGHAPTLSAWLSCWRWFVPGSKNCSFHQPQVFYFHSAGSHKHKHTRSEIISNCGKHKLLLLYLYL